MHIQLYATLRDIVGDSVIEVACRPGDTVAMLVDELIQRWPALQPKLQDAEGDLRDNIHILIDGRNIRFLDGLDTVLSADATISIFPPVGGGR